MELAMNIMLVVLMGLAWRYIRAVMRLKKIEIKLERAFSEHFPEQQIRLGGIARYRRYHSLMKTEESEALMLEAEKWIRRSRFKCSLALSIVLAWLICYIWIYGIL